MRSACLAALLVSCASSAEDAPSTVRFESTPYTLAPGEEKYLCFTMSLPEGRDTVVTAFTPEYGKIVHHLVLSYTLANEPAGMSECPVRFKDTWVPLFEAGRESGALRLPEGAAVRFRGQQLLMQLHLVNAGRSPVTETTAVRLDTVPPSRGTTSAGIFGFDNRVIALPPKSSNVSTTMSCTMTRDMDVFAVLGHMHERGSAIELRRGDELLYRTDWSFEVQPTTPVRFAVRRGDTIRLTCTWNNESDRTVGYGDSADDEMCSLIWYYTPYQALDGCARTE